MAEGDKKGKKETTFIGKCNFRGNEQIFGIKSDDRRQHMYVIGKTGVGKSALIKNLALQDIRAGKGIGIIDPHGEFVEEVLSQIPPERVNDVVYFNPVDTDYPIGFNVLEVPDLKYKHLVVSDLLGIFTKIWANVWSARMEYILQNCIMALLDTPGTTLLGIPRLLVDKDYRQKIVSNVKDPVVRSFWVHEYETWRDQFRNEAIVPIQNKVNQFLNTSFIRNIVGQPKSSLNVPEIMNSGKILLVNVSKGKVGEDNSALLGAMIITKIQLAAMERVRIKEDDRKDYYLYVDEFQNFATDSFASILSEARKYRLNLILAHQYIGQLETDVSTKVRDAVFGNTGTMICFRVGATDAEFLEKEFEPEFMGQDLINLPNYHVYLKLMVDGLTSRPFSAVTLPPLKFETALDIQEKIIRISRERYASPRQLVEEQITKWSGFGSGGEDEVGGGATMGTVSGGLIETPCWNCGKTATVPFKPDGKRPVYCMSCLKQIEDGKLIPLPERMPKVGREKFGQSLDSLGIEFAMPVGGDSRLGDRIPQRAGPALRQGPSSGGFSPRSQDMSRDQQKGFATSRPSNFTPQGQPRGDRRDGDQNRNFPRSRPQDQGPQRDRFSQGRDDRRGDRPRSQQPSGTILRSQPLVRVPQNTKPMSLSNLRSTDEKKEGEGTKRIEPRQDSQSQLQPKSPDLKKLLEEALKSAPKVAPTPPAPKKNSPPALAEVLEDAKTERERNVVNPGETIKF